MKLLLPELAKPIIVMKITSGLELSQSDFVEVGTYQLIRLGCGSILVILAAMTACKGPKKYNSTIGKWSMSR
jgi:hypothetical protein